MDEVGQLFLPAFARQLGAGHTRLADLHHRLPNLQHVANADFGLARPGKREIFTERSGRKFFAE